MISSRSRVLETFNCGRLFSRVLVEEERIFKVTRQPSKKRATTEKYKIRRLLKKRKDGIFGEFRGKLAVFRKDNVENMT